MTTTLTVSSALSTATAFCISRPMSGVIALRSAGRLIVMRPMPPSAVTRICSKDIVAPSGARQ
jgi:hypothetical protein